MKKAKRIQISIPQPCTQGWDDMSLVNGGRHCASCEKTVTDFTGMTDRELFQFFKGGHAGCGRFYAGQLERAITAPPAPPGWGAKIMLVASILFGLSKKTTAQHKSVPALSAIHQNLSGREEADDTDDRYNCIITISGFILDPAGRAVRGVRVSVGGKAHTVSDSAGHYLVKVPGESVKAWDLIVYKHPGYLDNSYQIFPDLVEENHLIVNMRMKWIVEEGEKLETYYTGAAIITYYADSWNTEYYEPSVAAENRFADYKRTGQGFTPVVITLPSFKFIGRFFSHAFRMKKRSDKNT